MNDSIEKFRTVNNSRTAAAGNKNRGEMVVGRYVEQQVNWEATV
jgi:hypothetical protein